MKNLFVALLALLFAFFLGCQSSITDPVVSEPTQFTDSAQEETIVYKDAVSMWPGVIKLDGSVREPIHNTSNTTLISGLVRYYIKPIRAGHHMITAVKVGVFVNAGFKRNFAETSAPWRVNGMTEETVYLLTTDHEVYTLDKEFLLTNTGDYRLKLALRFQVNEKDLKLISMELKKSPDVSSGDTEF
ncbi:MAG TPA: hypothetical protein VIY47_06055 [Ignavibacteriaceae bacterium]